jgi:pyruvate dehydrogenase (quinone)/pyruvate oxidase
MAAEAVLAIAEALPAAIVTTLPARPLVPNDHALYAGGLGQAGSEASSVLLAESDLVVMLGATWWPDEYVPTQAKVLQIDRAAAQIGRGHPLHKGIVGDAAELLPRLAAQLGTQPGPDRSVWRQRIAEVSGEWKERLEREGSGEAGGGAVADAAAGNGYAGGVSSVTEAGASRPAPKGLTGEAQRAAAPAAEAPAAAAPLAPQCVMRTIAEACAEGAIIAVDTGDHTLWFNRVFQAKPQQRILVSGRWRTLGFALPAAIAAKLEAPQRQVVAIAGDGGVVQTIMELQTAALYRLPIVLIVINNGCYAMERSRMVVAGLNTLGSGLANPDFAKLAESCGAAGYRADTAAQLEKALQQALAASVPALIDVRTAATVVPHTKL